MGADSWAGSFWEMYCLSSFFFTLTQWVATLSSQFQFSNVADVGHKHMYYVSEHMVDKLGAITYSLSPAAAVECSLHVLPYTPNVYKQCFFEQPINLDIISSHKCYPSLVHCHSFRDDESTPYLTPYMECLHLVT